MSKDKSILTDKLVKTLQSRVPSFDVKKDEENFQKLLNMSSLFYFVAQPQSCT